MLLGLRWDEDCKMITAYQEEVSEPTKSTLRTWKCFIRKGGPHITGDQLNDALASKKANFYSCSRAFRAKLLTPSREIVEKDKELALILIIKNENSMFKLLWASDVGQPRLLT